MAAEVRRFAVCGGATDLRRQVGATAWAVLEQLVAHSYGPANASIARASVRSLASDLGVSKDTAARALARLREAGLVAAEQSRANDGAFATGSYRVALPACLQLVDQPAVGQPHSRRAPSHTSEVAQLSLIDLEAHTS